MILYEVINPSDAATFYAASNEVAVAATLLLDGGRGAYGAKRCDGSWTGPILAFHGGEGWLRSLGMWPIDEWIDQHREAIAAALASVALGKPADRADFDDAVATIADPEARAEFIKRRNDRRRSSINDFESYAHELAGLLRSEAGRKAFAEGAAAGEAQG